MAGSLIADCGAVAHYLPWTAIGRRLGPLRALARAHGHQPRRWSTLFDRRSPYRVYWTRCRRCWADGRLIVSVDTGHGTATYRPLGPIFTQHCRASRAARCR